MDHDITICTNFLSLFFAFILFSFSCHTPPPPKKKTLMWISKILICHLRLVKNLSYPRLPMCVVQSGSSSAVHADCALALINWVCSRRKRIVWAFEIFGRRLLCFLCLLTLVQPHTRFKKKKKKRWEKSQDIGFMMLLQGAQYLCHSQILGIWILLYFVFIRFHVVYESIQKGKTAEGFVTVTSWTRVHYWDTM